jgi:hypothetical protein
VYISVNEKLQRPLSRAVITRAILLGIISPPCCNIVIIVCRTVGRSASAAKQTSDLAIAAVKPSHQHIVVVPIRGESISSEGLSLLAAQYLRAVERERGAGIPLSLF